MKRLLLVAVTAVMAFSFQMADSSVAEASRCAQLARRVASYKRIRANYLRSWNRCKWREGRYSPRCQRLRRAVNRWYRHVSRARSDYRRWGCSFSWDEWNDPWAERRRTYHNARCRSLASRVASYRRIRASYLRSWNRCKWREGRYSPRCQRLRRAVNRWYGNVSQARSDYRRWGCRFAWNQWNDPWAVRRGRYRRAKCRSLASQVNTYRSLRNSYSRTYNQYRCYRSSRRYSSYCSRLRRQINRYRSRVSIARSNYRAWGCRFVWNQWNDPWK